MSFEKRNLPLERSAFFFQEFSAPRQILCIEGRLVHVHLLSVLTETEGKSPKGTYVAAIVLVFYFCPSPMLSCSSGWHTAVTKIPKIKLVLEIRSATVAQFQLF